MEIEYPEGKEGLRQTVGMNIKGRVHSGGPLFHFETISRDIFLKFRRLPGELASIKGAAPSDTLHASYLLAFDTDF